MKKVHFIDISKLSRSDAEEYLKKINCKMARDEYNQTPKYKRFLNEMINTLGIWGI